VPSYCSQIVLSPILPPVFSLDLYRMTNRPARLADTKTISRTASKKDMTGASRLPTVRWHIHCSTFLLCTSTTRLDANTLFGHFRHLPAGVRWIYIENHATETCNSDRSARRRVDSNFRPLAWTTIAPHTYTYRRTQGRSTGWRYEPQF
jgi:hypothetical protein